MFRSALLLLLIIPAFAQDRTEQKLSDAMVKAMREAVRRENDLTAYCARKGMVIIQAPGEFMCGVKPAAPAPAVPNPANEQPKANPATPEANKAK